MSHKSIQVLGILVLILGVSASPEPLPSCSTFQSNENIYLTTNDIQRSNINSFFRGYNLQYSLSENKPDFVRLMDKRQLLNTQFYNLSNMVSYKINNPQNQGVSYLSVITENGDISTLHWGSYNNSVPTLQTSTTIQSSSSVRCFDNVIMESQKIGIINCVNRAAFGLKNVIYYVDLESGTVGRTSESHPYVEFKEIKTLKIHKYQDPVYKINYLIRVYSYDSVDEQNSDNTYLEILDINDKKIFNPQLVNIIDRSWLGLSALRISDFAILNTRFHVLDLNEGLFTINFQSNQKLILQDKYSFGMVMKKMDLYQDAFDQTIMGVFATYSSLYEIHLSSSQIQFKAKYSLTASTQIYQLQISRAFILATMKTLFTDSQGSEVEYNMATIFDKSQPSTLQTASDVIFNQNNRFFINLNPINNWMVFLSEQSIKNYVIAFPLLTIQNINPDIQGQSFNFSIKGTSKGRDSTAVTCQLNVNVGITKQNEMPIWQSQKSIPENYVQNSIGNLQIPIGSYIRGANITWQVQGYTSDSQQLRSWILKQNKSSISYSEDPDFGEIRYLKQAFKFFESYQLILQNSNHQMYWLYFNFNNNQVRCSWNEMEIPTSYGPIKELSVWDSKKTEKLILMIFESRPTAIIVYDSFAMEIIDEIQIQEGKELYDNIITDIEIRDDLLFVTLTYIKTILVYDISQSQFTYLYRIDSSSELGFFYPMQVVASKMDNSLIFVKNLDSIMTFRVSKTAFLLIEVVDVPYPQQNWEIKANDLYVMVLTPPDSIRLYKINEHTFKLQHMSDLPLYNHDIPDKFAMQFDAWNNLFYIQAINEEQETKILVYKIGYSSVMSLYDTYDYGISSQSQGNTSSLVFDVFSDEGINYIFVSSNDELKSFREYANAHAVVQNPTKNYSIKLSYSNQPSSKHEIKSNVNIREITNNIQPNPDIINKTGFLTDQILYKNNNLTLELNDSNWFTGHVTNYSIEGCQECGKKIRISNHLERVPQFDNNIGKSASLDMMNIGDRNLVQQANNIVVLFNNNTVQSYLSIPLQRYDYCYKINYSQKLNAIISLCSSYIEDRGYVYVTYLNNFKPIVSGPFFIQNGRVNKAQIIEDILMVFYYDSVFTQERPNKVIFYNIKNPEIHEDNFLPELQSITKLDLLSAIPSNSNELVMVSCHLESLEINGRYTLAIASQWTIFFMQLHQYALTMETISIQPVDIHQLLVTEHVVPPTTCFIKQVVIHSIQMLPTHYQIAYFVNVHNFDIFKLTSLFETKFKYFSTSLDLILKKYGFYQYKEEMKISENHLAVSQQLYSSSNSIMVVYNIQKSSVSTRYILGGYTNKFVTFDLIDNQKNQSISVISNIGEASTLQIHDQISLIIEGNLKRYQHPILIANNDQNKSQVPFQIPRLQYKKVSGPKGYMLQKVKFIDNQTEPILKQI